MGEMLDRCRTVRVRHTETLVLLHRIQESAHDARLAAEENMGTSRKIIASAELAALMYFEGAKPREG